MATLATTLGVLALAGLASVTAPPSIAPEKYVCYIALALIATALRVTKESVPGGTSMAFLFVLVSLEDLNVMQTLVVGAVAVALISPAHASKKNRLLLTCSDLLAIGCGTIAAHWAFRHPVLQSPQLELPLLFVAASAACFLASSIPAVIITWATDRSNDPSKYSIFWVLPYYLVSGAVTGIFAAGTHSLSIQSLIAYTPIALALWYAYRVYLQQLENHRARRHEVEALHLRTIETMALAIGARDQEMTKHLERVQVYAVEMGRELRLSSDQIEGLKAAALLHDIGKLGVPEHIISKPGRLTQEEFEKMKVHPTVGAEILERAQFPYPVVPYVRHHHERWDGSGYPEGLKGEEIPIGARILAVVDCLDALASDRQYRRALPIDAAVEQVAAEAGKQFDPKLISLLKKNYRKWEQLVASERTAKHEAESALTGSASRHGFESVVRTIGSSSAEMNTLFELTRELGNSLSLADTFAALASGLNRLVPYTALAVYLRRRDRLHARHLAGHFASIPDSLELDVGRGVSGLVAESGVALVNADPSLESPDPLVAIYFEGFRSSLSIAIPGDESVAGVLTLYHASPNGFTNDHLRKLQALLPKLSQAVLNGLRFQQAEDKAGTDHLTGLPNAHSLYLHLEQELGLSRCMNTPLAVVVSDLNGFKAVNDTLGHLTGNKLLQAVGVALRDNCREYDFVARMGGDEFVMILSGVQEDKAVARIRELREAVRSASEQVCREGMIQGSFGLAMFPRDAQTADELLACADRNMYRDKEQVKAQNAPAFAGMRAWKPAGPVTSSRTRSASPLHSLTLAPGTD